MVIIPCPLLSEDESVGGSNEDLPFYIEGKIEVNIEI